MQTPEGYRDTCFFCGQEWGKCSCNGAHGTLGTGDPSIDAYLLGFDFDDMWITDWTLDASGRFYVDPFVYYGDAYRAFLKSRAE